jgi:hypothetical protein
VDVQINQAWDQDLAGLKLGQPTVGPKLGGGLASLV